MADRIEAMILLGKGWTASDVTEALLMDRGTVREYLRRFEKGGLDRLLQMAYQGSDGYLNDDQLMDLADKLDLHVYSSTAEVIAFIIQRRWRIEYSERGVNSLLHRLGFAKADAAA